MTINSSSQDSHIYQLLRNQSLLTVLSDTELEYLAQSTRPVQVKPGNKLYDYSSLPPGIVLVQSGLLRLLYKDENGLPFTFCRVKPNSLVGYISLIRGTTGFALAAAEPSQVLIIPQYDFLSVYEKSNDLQSRCACLSPEELFSVALLSRRSNTASYQTVRDWSLRFLEEQVSAPNVLLLEPGEHRMGPQWGPCLASSSNITSVHPGEELLGPVDLVVKGHLPARVIDKSILSGTPTEQVEPLSTVDNNASPASTPELSIAAVSITEQREAVKDWYGDSSNDGTFPHLSGHGPVDAPLACLRMLARHYDLPFRRDVLRRILEDQVQRDTENQGISLLQLAAICDVMGLRSSPLQLTASQLPRLEYPVLAISKNTPLVLWCFSSSGNILVSDPSSDQTEKNISEFLSPNEEGRYELLHVLRSSHTPRRRFGLAWFLPALQEHKGILIQVLVASFFVQLFGLLNPLLIQQIIDAVISQGNISTLNVLGTLLVAMGLSQAALSALRTYLFSDTTNRIDVSLGSSIMSHLMRLPLSYFSNRPVGEVSSRINELEKIRRFLTGTALTVILDAVFALIYIAVMLLYSVALTFWALAVVPFFLGVTFVSSPIIRRQLRQQAEANSRVQSHLVESLSGMETLKGQNMELQSQWRWQDLYTSQIQSGFRNVVTSTAAGSISQFLEQLSGLLVLWVGATLVLSGDMTLGQLIAFRILAGYVTNPLLRLANLWQNFQETSLSLERLSDIVDHPEELELVGEQKPPMPPITGHVQYKSVSFGFVPNRPDQLTNVSLDVPAGSFVGIVGSSGSGKSTLLKLLTRLYETNHGIIRIDGHDISKVDLYSLRSQIGVVPQDSLLFDGTVQNNIALSRPAATFEEIQHAAQLACAHDFIELLPSGYSSSVGERGSGLSGGQRQRLAIARMILRNPRLLVLDEATSALDVDTERKLTANLIKTYSDRTVFFITHRLISLSQADLILVMDQGTLVEQGTHSELMALNGRYTSLYNQQANPFGPSSQNLIHTPQFSPVSDSDSTPDFSLPRLPQSLPSDIPSSDSLDSNQLICPSISFSPRCSKLYNTSFTSTSFTSDVSLVHSNGFHIPTFQAPDYHQTDITVVPRDPNDCTSYQSVQLDEMVVRHKYTTSITSPLQECNLDTPSSSATNRASLAPLVPDQPITPPLLSEDF